MKDRDKRDKRFRAKDRRAMNGAAPVSFIDSVLAEDKKKREEKLTQHAHNQPDEKI
jgi:hypothetical protein